MRDVLAASNRGVMSRLASSNTLLAFDYDGTLAPIVDDPEKALMRVRTRALFREVARLYPCMIISGRAQADARRRARALPLVGIFGNHGVEPWPQAELFAARVQCWLPELRRALASVPGVSIENKVYSVTVHYRCAPRREVARRRIVAIAEGLQGVRVIGGKCVVNLVSREAPHKGLALQAALARLRFDTALYVGDDDTDEDVFGIDEPAWVTVRVGRTARSQAAFFLRSQHCMDALLVRLARLRRGVPARSSQRTPPVDGQPSLVGTSG